MKTPTKHLIGFTCAWLMAGILPLSAEPADNAPFSKQSLVDSWTSAGSLIVNSNPEGIFGLFKTLHADKPTTSGSIPQGSCKKAESSVDDEEPIDDEPCKEPTPGEPEVAFSEVALKIFPLNNAEASGLFTRIQAFQRYQAAHIEFTRYRTEALTKDDLTAIEAQEHKTLSDLLLLNVRLYYAAANTADRCNRILRVKSLFGQYQQRFGVQDFAIYSGAKTLTYTQKETLGDLVPELPNPRVCAFKMQGNRSQQEKVVRDEATTLFDDKVIQQLETYKIGADKAGATFGTLKSKIKPENFPIRTQQILDFERDLINLQSNLTMVAKDSFRIQKIQEESKASQRGGYAVSFDHAGCGYLATIGDYFQQTFDVEPIKLENFVSECTPKVGKKLEGTAEKGKGNSPEVLGLAKQYITEASYLATAQVEDLLRFVDQQLVQNPKICSSTTHCFSACTLLMDELSPEANQKSRLANKLAPQGPKNYKPKETEEYMAKFKGNFESCMDQLYGYIDTKKDYSVDQKFQTEFAKELKRFTSKIDLRGP